MRQRPLRVLSAAITDLSSKPFLHCVVAPCALPESTSSDLSVLH